ncbi:MAG: right-handed parallel beta-helix repeat-containing protein [Candidatus Shapirobacteria bacterium]
MIKVKTILLSTLALFLMSVAPTFARGSFVTVNPATLENCSMVYPTAAPNVTCFNKIQTTVNMMGIGDTLWVAPGTYNEKVVINKKIIMKGGIKMAQKLGTSTIDGQDTNNFNFPLKSVVTVTGAGTVIDGFTIQGAGFGKAGITLTSAYNTIKRSTLTNNFYGIELRDSDYNVIDSNIITNSGWYGILIQNNEYFTTGGTKDQASTNNTIKNNTITNVSDAVGAIENCDNNQFTGNTIISTKGMALNLFGSDNNTVSGNTIKNSKKAITFYGSFNNNVTNNKILNNAQAFQVDAMWMATPSENNTVNWNNIVGNADIVKQGFGNSNTTFNIMNNWWGTAVRSEILSKIVVSNPATIVFDPFLAQEIPMMF